MSGQKLPRHLRWRCWYILQWLLFIFFAVGAVYGFSGANCMLGLVKGYYLNVSYTETMTSVGWLRSACSCSCSDFLALNTLCAVTICVSACFRTTFHAVVVSCAVWIGPLLFRIICRGGGYLLLAGTPLFLVMPGVVLDIYRVLFIPISVAVGSFVFCTYIGLNRYSTNVI